MPKSIKKNILVVEDEKLLLKAVITKLKISGFKAKGCKSAELAIKYLHLHKADLIWLDFLLPGMSGLDFLEWLRKSRHKKIPVIVVANSGGPGSMKKAFDLNVIDYKVKTNYKLEEIISNINKILK